MLGEDLLHGLGAMTQERNAIGDLRGGGGAVPCPVGVGGRAIPRAHLHARVGLEPLRERVALAVREQGDGLAALPVDENRAIGVAFA
jgi:hypothetical protein